jgi:chromosome segregation ATPase
VAAKKRDAIATYNAAYAACAELWFQDGLKPTVALVGQRIGIQHNVVIGRALKDWKTDVDFERLQDERLAAARAAQPERDARLDQALAGVVRLAHEEARREFETLRDGLERERAALRAEAEAARTERDQAVRAWDAYRSASERERETLRERVAALERELAAARLEAGEARAAGAALEARLAEQSGRLAGLEAALDELAAARAEALAALEARAAAEHDWHLRRIQEEKEAARAAAEERIERLQRRVLELEPQAQAAERLQDLVRRQTDTLAALQREWTAWHSGSEAERRRKPGAKGRRR